MSAPISVVLAQLPIPNNNSFPALEVKAEQPTFILGRNGVGKSALVHYLRGHLGEKVVYLPGSRPSYFDAESLSITPQGRNQLIQNLRSWDAIPDTRWKSFSGTSRNEKAIHDLLVAENQYKIDAAEDIASHRNMDEAIAKLQSKKSPLDRVNFLLKQAGIPVHIVVHQGGLHATRGNSRYSIAKMSDGERSALIFAAEIVAALPASIFLVDEPELHLHRAIVVPLLNAFIAERPDCGFVISTHELDLPTAASFSQIILVRGSTWNSDVVTAWDIDVINDCQEIPESLRVDILGSRRKILFIEGNSSSSLDQPLYELLFPGVSIRPRESCTEVMRAVRGLRAVESLHRALCFGLIDHDGMSDDKVVELASQHIFALPIFSVESLIYSEDVVRSLASRQAETFGLLEQDLLNAVRVESLQVLRQEQPRQHLASRLAERKIRDMVTSRLPSRDEIRTSQNSEINIRITSPYQTELSFIDQRLQTGDVYSLIYRYPVRETQLLVAIAKALRFNGRQDYESAALRKISQDANLQTSLRRRLGSLATLLAN
ncbi:AAA family ATPase [Herbaspirillum robiniae]|uniref:AAA family ATPase n=1 Tax=Herbaspirillum robiniae TaxID=2014887 RepID=UPI003D770E64